MAEINKNEVYTTLEAQDLLKVSNSTIKRLLKNGLIKANKIGKQYRFLGHDLLRILSPEVDEKTTELYQKVKMKTIEKTREW